MEVGIVTPIKYLDLNLSNLPLCYASLLGNENYLNFYRSRVGEVILDTSPVLPRRIDLDLLLRGIHLVKPKLVILPSIDYSCDRTIVAVQDFLRLGKVGYYVGVVQGLDLGSLRKCYKFLKKHCSIIGLPSPLETVARRDEIARDLHIKERLLYIEVYGDPYKEVPPASSLGICTSYPIRLAASLRKLSEYSPTPPPLDFDKEDLIEGLVEGNIKEYLEVVRSARSNR